MQIAIPRDQIEAFCRRNNIRRMSVFGSALNGGLREASDLDVLVEFEPGREPGYAFFGMERELSGMFGRRVDLNTPGSLGPRYRERVLSEAEVIYAGA